MLGTFMKSIREQEELKWGDANEPCEPIPGAVIVEKPLGHFHKDGVNDAERKNGLVAPRQMYPLIEQAYRTETKPKSSIKDHLQYNSEIFSKFNAVASWPENKSLAWFPTRRSAEEIATENPKNRWVAFPYTKYLNSVMNVNQAACVLLTSEQFAFKYGIKQEKLVYLRGCGECVEPGYFVTSRASLGKSVGMKVSLETALKHAQCTAKDIAVFDLYSCFPIAVETACDVLQIDPLKETRPLTVTGGLPYYGGAGNSYTLVSIAAMTQYLRKRPIHELGLLNGNGWFLTKHATGIYSRTRPTTSRWSREDPKTVQSQADASTPLKQVALNPNGLGRVESYICDFSARKKKTLVFVVGIMLDGPDVNKRFIASSGAQNVRSWMEHDGVGLRVVVSTPDEKKPSGFVLASGESFQSRPLSGIKAEGSVAKL